jgi:hypothetical protein
MRAFSYATRVYTLDVRYGTHMCTRSSYTPWLEDVCSMSRPTLEMHSSRILSYNTLQIGTTSIDPSSENILVQIAFSSASVDGYSCSNVNVTLNL